MYTVYTHINLCIDLLIFIIFIWEKRFQDMIPIAIPWRLGGAWTCTPQSGALSRRSSRLFSSIFPRYLHLLAGGALPNRAQQWLGMVDYWSCHITWLTVANLCNLSITVQHRNKIGMFLWSAVDAIGAAIGPSWQTPLVWPLMNSRPHDIHESRELFGFCIPSKDGSLL